MKKSFLALASFAAIAVGCQVEKMTDELPLVDEAVVYEAVTEAYAPATKTAMTAGKEVVWSADDQIAVFQGNTYYDLFQVTSASAGKKEASFTLKSDRDASNEELPYNGAFYPVYEGMESYEEEGAFVVWNFALPTTQTYVAGSFANGAFPMIAVSEDNQFEFKNVLGALKLSLTGNRAVKSITVADNAGNALAGAVRVYYSAGEEPEAVFEMDYMTGAYVSSVTLDCGEGVELNENTATEFIIALPETEFENGFTVTLTDTEYNVLKFQAPASEKNHIERSAILLMPELDVETLTQDVEFKAVPSITDVTLDIKVNVEGADGFYGIFVNEYNWASFKPYLEKGDVPFTMVLQGGMPYEMPARRYDSEVTGIKLSELGLSDDYIEWGEINLVQPNSKYYVLLVPAFAEKDAAMNQGGGDEEEYPEDDWVVMSLTGADEEETPAVAGYTLADAIIYEVSTSGFVTGGESTLTSSKEESYLTSYVTINPSDDVEYIFFNVYGEDEEIPTNANYLDDFAIYNDAYYDSSEMESVYVKVGDDKSMLPGTSWKVAVILANGEGKASLHLIDVNLKAIPYSEDLDAVAFGEYGYDETLQEMFAEIAEWPEDAEIYYTFNYQDEPYTGWDLASEQADALDGAYAYTRVEDTDIKDGVISLYKSFRQSTRASKQGFHVIAVKDGYVGKVHTAIIDIPAKQN